ncbi:hypothetical protein HNY42_15785 (plasmid) [Exiguobacterium sp. Helios]|uniref:hypothetical protein n=1 Tax=Exiguobacterium sp. Helios TaxID=2735868 RepID=UPI00165D7166|nr:hypothetical protein [Exiguobacterium sp. Helios]QNR22459.1 hypothetical protein HNY42_15785 [Exiguobacterium sp. Helios]
MRRLEAFTLATFLELQPTHVTVLIHQARYDIPVSYDEYSFLEILQEEPLLLLPVSRDRRHLLLDRLATDPMVLEELNDFEGAADSSVSSEGA